MAYIKTYTFNHFYQQYLVLLTVVPRDSRTSRRQGRCLDTQTHVQKQNNRRYDDDLPLPYLPSWTEVAESPFRSGMLFRVEKTATRRFDGEVVTVNSVVVRGGNGNADRRDGDTFYRLCMYACCISRVTK